MEWRSIRCPMAAVLAAFLLAPALPGKSFLAGAQKPSTPKYDSLISPDSLAGVCAKVLKSAATTSEVSKVQAFCKLNASASATDAEWAEWESAAVPSPTELVEAEREVQAQAVPDPLANLNDETTRYLFAGTGRSGSTPLFNESAILWGVTDFVVDRIQADIAEIGLSQFVRRTCEEALAVRLIASEKRLRVGPATSKGDHKPFLPLPRTCELLEQSLNRIRVPALAAVRATARLDLEQLPSGLTHYVSVTLKDYPNKGVRDGAAIAYMSVQMAASLARDGILLKALITPFDSIVPSQLGLNCTDTPAAMALYQLAALAKTLTGGSDLSGERAGRARQIGFALKTLVINIRHSRLKDTWPSGGKCSASPGAIGTRLYDARNLYLLGLSLNEAVSGVKSAYLGLREQETGAEGTTDSRLAYVRRVAEAAFEIVHLAVTQQLGDAAKPYLTVLGHTRETADALIRHEYGAGLVAGLGMMETFIAAADFRYDELQKVRPILTLVADVAEADNAQGVSDALKRVVAPRTSYLRKRSSDDNKGFNPGKIYFTVDAYAGAIAGRERLESTGEEKGFIAPYVPLGIEVGVPLHRAMSLGIFAHALDIGALASYRINSETDVSTAPNVSLRQVFSPGIGVVIGLTRLPLAAGFLVRGASPRLRRINSAGELTDSDVTRRWAGFVAYDIRLF